MMPFGIQLNQSLELIMEIIKTAALINKAITSIATRGVKLDSSIHVAAVSVMQHATDHGDTTLADKLVLAMPKGSRKLALVEFVLAFGQLAKLDSASAADKEAITAGRIFKMDKTRTLNMTEAMQTPWTEFKKEASVMTAFDAQAAVRSLLARLRSASEAGIDMQHKVEALAEAKSIVELLSK